MAEVLKEWLTERLQLPIKWETDEFGDMMKNGYLIAGVLLSYHVINDEEYSLIKSSLVSEDIKNNWKYLSKWLRSLEVNLNDIDLQCAMEGKGSILLRLFYQLFLHLDKRDRTNFIKRERQMVSRLVENVNNRFKVHRIEDDKESLVDDLSKPLLDEKLYIEWQRKKAERVKETYDFLRHKYSKTLNKIDETHYPTYFTFNLPKNARDPQKQKEEMDKFTQRYPCKFENFTYDDLMKLEEKANERRKSLVDTDWAKDYMDNLYTRMHKKSDSEEFQKQLRNDISGSLWDLSVNEEEVKYDTELAKKVMKLSQFEKQMCTQIMETKQQARNLFNNRVEAERAFSNQREQQFNQFLDNVREQIQLEVDEIDFEQKRQNMLHKKLYAEKMKRKRQHYYEICYDTMLSIVDYVTKYGYFKRLIGDDIPNHFIHEWKNLFFKQQPIFDILNPVENMLKEHSFEEEVVEEEEEVIRLELDRQEALNDSEFNEYHNYLYPWTLDILIPNYDPDSEERKYEYLGTRILGHLVYTLLEIKYPYPPPHPPAELPPFSSKVVLRGLPDRSITTPMQVLLSLRKIHVVRLEAAINFCLRKFKIEMIGAIDIELSYEKFIASAQEEESKELIRLMKAEDEVQSKSIENVSIITGIPPPNTKQTQTPKMIPEEEIYLSRAAELGKYAYETLNFGDSLTDHLIASMIVEYLKDQQDITGFVIVNYPNSYREAQILEETFSGRAPPNEDEVDERDDVYLEESISKHRKKEKDPFKEVRISKLVNDPHKKRIEKPFESYFTCYIHLKPTKNILQEFVIWDLTNENSEFIERFYAILGINYSMYYETIEKDLLALICKYIIGDLIMPMKSSDSLFGENVLSNLDFPDSDDKRTKSKIIKPEISIKGKSKEKLKRGCQISKISLKNDLETVKAPISSEDLHDIITISEIVSEVENEDPTFVNIEQIKLIPGEEDWDYGEIPIPEIIGVALASCWEKIEKTYINDMQQLFFAKRLQMNCLIPYTSFIKDKMEQIITMPCDKQDLVTNFQSQYNEFENDWRDINLVKNEWHCRIKELKNNLYHICDERKSNAEQQRHALICENWAMEELTCMANTYISCMQTELNRCVLTFQALHDFYFAMIRHMPPNERKISKDLTKISRDNDETSGSKKGGEDKVYRQLKLAYQDLQLRNIEIDYSNNPFNMVIENNVKFALKTIKDMNDSYRSNISKEYSEVVKVSIPAKKKEDGASKESMNIEEIFKENALKCIEEWMVGINGEMYRAILKITALQNKCYIDMKLFNDHIYNTFTKVQNDINSYYMNEIKSVDQLCEYLQMAVESGRKIPETLLLEHDTFVIDPNMSQYESSSIELDTADLKEMVTDIEFKISQLARLRTQFKIVAPKGIALQQAFIYLLQDFILFGKESCEGALFPKTWIALDPEQVPKLVNLLFGDTVYVDWRDFLIYCLNLRFPAVEELLEIRKNFRSSDLDSTELICRNKFINEKFWFDEEFDIDDKYSQLRKNLIKHFLFELYEADEDMMNYSAFLLAFCKSVDPIEGFSSAIAMTVGKKICYSMENCKEVICNMIKDKEYKDESLACAMKCTGQFLDALITNVINWCEGTTIIEPEYTEVSPEDKKVNKGKGDKNVKKVEMLPSAQLPKSSKSLTSQSKTARSTSNVKSTFICRPCEDEQEVEEKLQEEEVIEEEHKTEPIEDTSLIYAVSQDVIWNVLKICLPWHFQLVPEKKPTPYVKQVEELMKTLQIDTDNGDIYVCKFLSDPQICKLLHKTKKFTAFNLTEEIRKVL